MGTKKTKTSKAAKTVKTVAGKLLGKRGGAKRRSKGPTYWANKVLVEKLKKRYHRLKYGGMR